MEQSIAVMNYDLYSPPTPADVPATPAAAKRVGGYVLTGELLDEAGIIVWLRLKALRARRPQLSEAAMIKRLIIWREWKRSWCSYAATALLVAMYYRRGRSRQHIYYIMRRMRQDGILASLPE